MKNTMCKVYVTEIFEVYVKERREILVHLMYGKLPAYVMQKAVC